MMSTIGGLLGGPEAWPQLSFQPPLPQTPKQTAKKTTPCPNDCGRMFVSQESARQHAPYCRRKSDRTNKTAEPVAPVEPVLSPHGSYEHVEISRGRSVYFERTEDWDPSRLIPGTEALRLGGNFDIKDQHLDDIIAAGSYFCHSLLAFRSGNHNKDNRACLTDLAVICLAEACPNLRHLSLSGSKFLTDTALLTILEKCPELRYIAISGQSTTGLGAIKRPAIDAIRARPEIGQYLQKMCLINQGSFDFDFMGSLHLLCLSRPKLVIAHGLSAVQDIRFWEGSKRTYAPADTERALGLAGWCLEVLSPVEIKDVIEGKEILNRFKRSWDAGPETSNPPKKKKKRKTGNQPPRAPEGSTTVVDIMGQPIAGNILTMADNNLYWDDRERHEVRENRAMIHEGSYLDLPHIRRLSERFAEQARIPSTF